MAISRIGVSSNVEAVSGDLTVTGLPTTVAGDIIIVAVTSHDNVALSFPAGFTIYQEGNNTTAMRSTLAWKRATGTSGPITITHAAGDGICATAIVYRGCIVNGSPIDAARMTHNSSSGTCTAAAVVTTQVNCVLLFTMHEGDNGKSSAQSFATAGSATERFDNYAASGLDEAVSGADIVPWSGAGSTGNATGTFSLAYVNTGAITALAPAILPTFVSVSSQGVASGDVTFFASNITCSPGDILISVSTSHDNVALSFPAGWTVYQEYQTGTTARATLAWYRVPSEGLSDFTIIHSGGAELSISISAYNNCVNSGSPIDASSIEPSTSDGTYCGTFTGLVPTSNQGVLVLFTMHCEYAYTSSGQTIGIPCTERFDNTLSVNVAVSGADAGWFSAASTQTGSGTWSGSVAVGKGNIAGMTALRPGLSCPAEDTSHPVVSSVRLISLTAVVAASLLTLGSDDFLPVYVPPTPFISEEEYWTNLGSIPARSYTLYLPDPNEDPAGSLYLPSVLDDDGLWAQFLRPVRSGRAVLDVLFEDEDYQPVGPGEEYDFVIPVVVQQKRVRHLLDAEDFLPRRRRPPEE